MDLVWVVSEMRSGEQTTLKIAATKKIAEKYVEGRFELYMNDHNKWVISSNSSDEKTYAHVEKECWAEYEEDPDDYFDNHPGCVFLTIEKWSVLTD